MVRTFQSWVTRSSPATWTWTCSMGAWNVTWSPLSVANSWMLMGWILTLIPSSPHRTLLVWTWGASLVLSRPHLRAGCQAEGSLRKGEVGRADPQTDARPTEKTLCQICSQQVDSDTVYSLTPLWARAFPTPAETVIGPFPWVKHLPSHRTLSIMYAKPSLYGVTATCQRRTAPASTAHPVQSTPSAGGPSCGVLIARWFMGCVKRCFVFVFLWLSVSHMHWLGVFLC